MTKQIGQVHLLSFVKVVTVIFALIGAIFGIGYVFGGLVIDGFVTVGWFSPDTFETPGLSEGTWLAFGALIGMPFIGIVSGAVAGLTLGIVYNCAVRLVGGIKVNID